MIRLTCDKCERPLDVPEEMAGRKFACPHCGDTNLVPYASTAGGAPAAARAPDRASAAGLPPDSGPEQRVLLVRPAMLRARPGSFLLLVLGLAAGLGGAVYFRAQPGPMWLCLALAAGAAVVLGVWKVKTLGAALEVTNKRSIERTGLLSRATTEVLHDDIKNFQITQTFWERVWGVGRIGISSAGQDGVEIVARDVPRPDRVKRVIDLYRPM